jgi:ribonuclease HI
MVSEENILENNNWRRMRFRNNKVWAALDPAGDLMTKGGKALIKYQLDQPHEYWVFAKAVEPLDEIPTVSESTNLKQPAPPRKAKRSEKRVLLQEEDIDPNALGECICLYTDGASSGNPGPSGIGVLMRYKSHEKKISRSLGLATNNIAELEAIRVGLSEVKNKKLPVRVFTDSSYALGLLAKGWKPKKNQELVAEIRKLTAQFADLRFIKVKGHAGHPENECADHLATTAAKSQP